MLDGRATVRLLEVDPDLGAGLAPEALEDARGRLVAPVLHIEAGDLDVEAALPSRDGHLGVLVVEGLLTRDVVIGETTCAELVGPGDLLRPWDDPAAGGPIPSQVEWHVLAPTTLALLDRDVAAAVGSWPEVTTALVTRAVTRAQTLAVALSISCITGLKIRIQAMLWHLADRFGKVGPAGVVVPLPVTHQVIGRLVGASRPSVSTAMKELEQERAISRADGCGYVLHGEPPEIARLMADRRLAARAALRA